MSTDSDDTARAHPGLGWANPAAARERARLARRHRAEQIRQTAADAAGTAAGDEREFWRGVHDDATAPASRLVEADDGRVVGLVDLDGDGVPSVLERAIAAGNQISGIDWGEVTDPIDERLAEDHDWPLLAAALDRATEAGYDVPANLPRLAEQAPLPYLRPARELAYRLIRDYPAAAPDTPAPPQATRPGAPDSTSRGVEPPAVRPDRLPPAPGL